MLKPLVRKCWKMNLLYWRRLLQKQESLGFRIVREREHIAMVRDNADGTRNSVDLTQSCIIKGLYFTDYLYTCWDST